MSLCQLNATAVPLLKLGFSAVSLFLQAGQLYAQNQISFDFMRQLQLVGGENFPQAPCAKSCWDFAHKALALLGLHRWLTLAEKKKTSAKYF
ncbi:MAG: hypothetical protein FWF81_00630 [Defluviitaleaceae bacterium]|nr:hypothetical protein [Defluviitaleaceae bacterium]